MAYWQRKKKSGAVMVYQYQKEVGKPVALERSLVQHLDGKSDAEIERWVRKWEADNGIVQRNRGRRNATVSWTPQLEKMFKAYQKERMKEENVGDRTLQNERVMFERYILPYFVEKHGRNHPSRWADVGHGFRGWLTETTALEVKYKKEIILAANRFGAYLKEAGVISDTWKLKPPKLGQKRRFRKTPLPRKVTPDEVLKVAKLLQPKNTHWALALLVGYFASLRPEETFALTKADFLAGEEAIKESQTRDRIIKYDLGSKLVVDVNKALVEGFKLGPPKNHNSNGKVLVWHPDGARAIAAILKAWPVGVPFFANGKSTLFKKYKAEAKDRLGVTLHDLRRASGLYLGRTVGVDPLLLQDMLRHGDLEMVLLYTRHPGEDEKDTRQQNFDDVV